MTTEAPKQRPRLRGYFHQEAFFLFLGLCIFLIISSPGLMKTLSSLVYSFSLLFLFGTSAIYHRVHWEPAPRAVMKRLDHSAIFVLIAGSFTPICLLALPDLISARLMKLIWFLAFFGILKSVFWVKAPKWLNAILYVGMGWIAAPYLPELNEALGTTRVALILIGGIIYTVGGVFYALRWPKLSPSTFGFHELFHVFTIIAAALHFVVIYQLTVGAP